MPSRRARKVQPHSEGEGVVAGGAGGAGRSAAGREEGSDVYVPPCRTGQEGARHEVNASQLTSCPR